MDLNSAWIFVKVIQAGSFTQAARQLKMPVSTVSTKVSQLEQHLGVSLIRRTTRKLHPTEAGIRYFEHAVRAVAELQEAEASTSLAQEDARGFVRVTAPVEMGMTTLSDVVAEFLGKHPQVQIELVLTDRVVDLIGEGIDLGIRVGELEDSSLISKRLGVTQFQLFASPSYLKKAGELRKPKDLEQHQCLGFHEHPDSGVWELRNREKLVRVSVRGPFSVNNLASIERLARQGRGIALLPEYLCTDDVKEGTLVRVLKDWTGEQVPFHLVYPQQKFVPKRVRALIDYLSENLKVVF